MFRMDDPGIHRDIMEDQTTTATGPMCLWADGSFSNHRSPGGDQRGASAGDEDLAGQWVHADRLSGLHTCVQQFVWVITPAISVTISEVRRPVRATYTPETVLYK